MIKHLHPSLLICRVIQEMKALGMQDVPVGIIPLGTGNDLHQALTEICRKPSYISLPNPAEPDRFFAQIYRGQDIAVDMWTLTTEPLNSTTRKVSDQSLPPTSQLRSLLPLKTRWTSKSINNYFGIGVDGHISLIFDELRRKYPVLFFSQTINKFLYMLVGIFYFFILKQQELPSLIELECDGIPVAIPPGTRGIIVLNINSYAGGTKLWHFDGLPKSESQGRWKSSSASDQTLEVRTCFHNDIDLSYVLEY